MKEGKYNLLKALSWYTIGNVIVKAVNFLTLRLFTGLLTTSDYGVFGIYQSYLGIFEMVILFGTVHTIKMVKYDEKVDYEKYVSSIINIPILGSIILLLITSVVAVFHQTIFDLSFTIWYAIFFSACFQAIANIIVGKMILDGEYKKYIVYSLVNTILNLGISIFLCYTLFRAENTYWARIIGTLVANVISCLYVCCVNRIQRPNYTYIKNGIKMGFPLLIHSVATQVLVQTDKIAISQLSSYESVGLYTAAASIAVIPMTILSSIENSWSPWFFECLSTSKYHEIKKKNTWIVLLFALGLALFILGCPEIVMIMTHISYWDSVNVLIPLAIAAFAELIYIIPLNLELYYKKSKSIWIYTTIAVVCNIVLDIVFIRLFGYIMAAYVTCFSRFLLFVLHYIRAKKIDSNNLFDIRVVIVSIIVLVLMDRFTIVFMEYRITRWTIIFVVIIVASIVLYINHKKKKVV